MLSIFYGFNAVLPCNCRLGMVLLPLLQLVYSPWPIRTIHRPTAWLCQCIFASTLYHLLRFCTLGSLFSLVVPSVASSFGNSWHNRSLKWIRASVWMIADVTNRLFDRIVLPASWLWKDSFRHVCHFTLLHICCCAKTLHAFPLLSECHDWSSSTHLALHATVATDYFSSKCWWVANGSNTRKHFPWFDSLTLTTWLHRPQVPFTNSLGWLRYKFSWNQTQVSSFRATCSNNCTT